MPRIQRNTIGTVIQQGPPSDVIEAAATTAAAQAVTDEIAGRELVEAGKTSIEPVLLLSAAGSRNRAGAVSPTVSGVTTVAGTYGDAWYRAAGNAYISISNASNYIDRDEGTVLIRMAGPGLAVGEAHQALTTAGGTSPFTAAIRRVRAFAKLNYAEMSIGVPVVAQQSDANAAPDDTLVAYGMSWKDGTARFYVDGALIGTQAYTPGSVNPGTIYLALSSGAFGQVWEGHLFYNDQLPDSEIARIHGLTEAWTWANGTVAPTDALALGATAAAFGTRSAAIGSGAFVTDDDTTVIAADVFEVQPSSGAAASVFRLYSPDGSVGEITVSDTDGIAVNGNPIEGVPAETVYPVITTGTAGGSTQIAGSAAVAWNHPAIRYLGAIMAESSGTGYSTGISASRLPYTMDLMFDGDELELDVMGTNDDYRVMVDGVYPHETPHDGPPNDSARYLIHLDFGSRANRHLRIECGPFARIYGIRKRPTDTVWASLDPDTATRVVYVGDSWTQAGNSYETVFRHDGFPHVSGRLVGWSDIFASGIGGTGYLNNGGSYQTYRGRLATDVTAHNPDVVIVSGGLNDASLAPGAAAIETEAGLLYDEIATALPDATLIVIAPFNFSGTPSAALSAVRTGVLAAATGRADLVIDPIGEGWITGTGNVEAPAGNGNADYYIAQAHPETDGHAYLGTRVAQALLASGLV